jgi:hypothetical protein
MTRLLKAYALLSALVACSDAAGPVTPIVASVQLSATAVSMAPGASSTLTAVPRTSNGAAVPGRTIAWTSSAADVATVNGQGQVTGVSSGTAVIRAAVEGKFAEAIVTVIPTGGDLVASRWRMQSFDGHAIPAVYGTFYDEPVGDHIVAKVEIVLDSATKTMWSNRTYQRRYFFTELHDGVVMVKYSWGDHGQFALGQGSPVPLTLTSDYIQHLMTSGTVAADGRLELTESLWIGETPRQTIWSRLHP